ncbi:hypothetical protein [Chloracidobacterium aggregatum]
MVRQRGSHTRLQKHTGIEVLKITVVQSNALHWYIF